MCDHEGREVRLTGKASQHHLDIIQKALEETLGCEMEMFLLTVTFIKKENRQLAQIGGHTQGDDNDLNEKLDILNVHNECCDLTMREFLGSTR